MVKTVLVMDMPEQVWNRRVNDGKIELLQNPTEKNKTVRHAIITGETGEYGGWAKILDYIGVGWGPTTIGDNCKGQMSLPLDQMI